MLKFGKALPAIWRCRRFHVAADDNRVVFLAAARLTGLNVPAAYADDFSVSGANQPMTATGLAAGHPFEAWFVFDKSADPHRRAAVPRTRGFADVNIISWRRRSGAPSQRQERMPSGKDFQATVNLISACDR